MSPYREAPPSKAVRLLEAVSQHLMEMDAPRFWQVYERLGMALTPATRAAPRKILVIGLILYTNGKHPGRPSFERLLEVLDELDPQTPTT